MSSVLCSWLKENLLSDRNSFPIFFRNREALKNFGINSAGGVAEREGCMAHKLTALLGIRADNLK